MRLRRVKTRLTRFGNPSKASHRPEIRLSGALEVGLQNIIRKKSVESVVQQVAEGKRPGCLMRKGANVIH